MTTTDEPDLVLPEAIDDLNDTFVDGIVVVYERGETLLGFYDGIRLDPLAKHTYYRIHQRGQWVATAYDYDHDPVFPAAVKQVSTESNSMYAFSPANSHTMRLDDGQVAISIYYIGSVDLYPVTHPGYEFLKGLLEGATSPA